MKNLLKTSVTLLVCLTIFSCSKDDETSTINKVKMNGESFSINAASIIGISMGEDGHSAISFSNASETQGKTLTIDVESFTKETIEGTYSYPHNDDDKKLDDWLTNYVVFEGSEGTSSNLDEGTVSIKHNGDNNYTIDMALTMVDGVTFSGSYTGEFTVMFMNN